MPITLDHIRAVHGHVTKIDSAISHVMLFYSFRTIGEIVDRDSMKKTFPLLQ